MASTPSSSLAGNGAGNVGLVLGIGLDDLDRLADDGWAEIGHGHAGGGDRAGATAAGVGAGEVGEDADADGCRGSCAGSCALGTDEARRGRKRGCGEEGAAGKRHGRVLIAFMGGV